MNLGPKDRREGSLFYLLVAFFCRVTYRSLMMLFRFHRSEAAMVLAGCLLGTTQAGWATPPRGAAEIFAEHERGVNSPCGEILFVKKLAAELPALDAPTAQQLREMIERHFEKHLRQLPLWIAEALANDQDPELRDAAFAALETTAKIPGNKLLERVVQVLNQLPPKIAEVATQRLKNNFSSQHLSFLWPLSSKHRHLVSADLWKQWRVADQLVHGSSGAATQKYVAPNDILTHLEQILTLPIDSPEFSSASELSLAKIEELFQTARDVGLAGMFVDRARVLYSSREEVVRRLNYLYLQSSAIDRPLDLDFIPRSHEF
ncbi:MAG TPA: hypothetical protein PLH57_08985, partial [Oligoflexia bacterium]|nr:hypothetical protein [Oligoflexia bacterium]